ncbi:alpha/beta fold hydrolase [Mucilaginibacter koreensis]
MLFPILSAFSQRATKGKAKTGYGNNPSAGHYANLRGFNLYYETYGSGRPLLLIHGNGGSIKAFENQIPYFAKHYRVIAADSRSQGKSKDPKDSLSYSMMADDMDSLLNYLHVKSCYVIGWSDGGINGLLLAVRHPDKVRKLAISGANLVSDSTAFGPGSYRALKAEDFALKKLAFTGNKARNAYKLVHLMATKPQIQPALLKQVKCPTLVIGGDHDAILPQHTLLIAQSIPNAYLWILPNSGHDTLIKYKDQFNATVSNFFTGKMQQ